MSQLDLLYANDVEMIIRDAVCDQKLDLMQTKELIFKTLKSGENPHAADIKLVETYFIKLLLEQARLEIEQCFEEHCHNKDFANDFARRADQLATLKDIMNLLKPSFYAPRLESYLLLVNEDDMTTFVANLNAYFWQRILHVADSSCAEMEMLQSLTVCFQQKKISSALRKKLVKFKADLSSQSRSAHFLRVVVKNLSDESQRNLSSVERKLLRSIKSLKSDHLFLENQLSKVLDFYLSSVQITIENVGNRWIAEIKGGVISLAEELPKIDTLLNMNAPRKCVNELRFVAFYMLKIDHDLENSRWHGFNICVIASRIYVTKECQWNVSGVSSTRFYEKALNGRSNGDNGQDAVDGLAGESGGNVMIIAEEMNHAERLTIVLKGGNGSNGQDGGDGANGEDGQGRSISTLRDEYKSPVRWNGISSKRKKLFDNILSLGKVKTNWESRVNRFIEVHRESGEKIICSFSRYWDFQGYLLWKGSEGKVGGHGGLNGLGGEGGYHGECLAISKQNKTFPVHIQTGKGSPGLSGKPGRTGEYGKNGWDVGYTDYSYWQRACEFGIHQNERLTLDYSTDSSDRAYCAYRYDELGSSACYATITASALQHRKLNESERVRNKRKEDQRSQEAKATRKNAIQRKDIEKTYGHHFQQGDILLQTVSGMSAQAFMTFDLMQQKAKEMLDEVDRLKERSRENVSRYTIYQRDTNAKRTATIVTTNSVSRDERKSTILEMITKNSDKEDAWRNLLDEEFSTTELQPMENCFRNYCDARTIKTAEMRRIEQKFGLLKFQSAIDDTCSIESLQDLAADKYFNSGQYLMIAAHSAPSDPEWLQEFQNETCHDYVIKETFQAILKYRVSSEALNVVKLNGNRLVAIKIGVNTMEEYLSNLGVDEEYDSKQLTELKENIDEWRKLREVLNMLEPTTLHHAELKTVLPVYEKKLLKDNKKLAKYLFDLHNAYRCVQQANSTLSTMIDWLIIESASSSKVDPQIKEYVQCAEDFMTAKQNSLKDILHTVQNLSRRPPKARWFKAHEYPDFGTISKVQKFKLKRQIDENVLRKLYSLYTKKESETMDWHPYIDDNILDICFKTIRSNQNGISAPLWELIAWKNEHNIRIYVANDEGRLVCTQDHFPNGTRTENILIKSDQTIQRLEIDRDFVELFLLRRQLVREWQQKRKTPCYKLPGNGAYGDEEFVVYQLGEFFTERDRDNMKVRLEKLSTTFIGENSILSSLLHCFMCNGCQLIANEISLFVNCILQWQAKFDLNSEFYAYLLLSHSQYQLIDELVLMELEHLLRRRLNDKALLRTLLSKITDISIKILLTKKLNQTKSLIEEEIFVSMLQSLPYVNSDIDLLKRLDVSDWASTLRETYWQHALSNGKVDLNNESLEQCAFYFVKLESLYGRDIIMHLINVLKEAILFSTKTLLTLVHRFYAEDLELCDDVLNDLDTLNTVLKNFCEWPKERYDGPELLKLCKRQKKANERNLKQIEHIMAKLGLSESDDRDIERLADMVTKARKHDTIYQHISKISTKLVRTANAENPILMKAIRFINRKNEGENVQTDASSELDIDTCYLNDNNFKKVVEAIKSQIRELTAIKNHHFYLLDIINRGIMMKRGFGLRNTQKLVVMLMLMNERGILSQVATGEGKTLIITTFCIIKCLYGEKLDIVTSSSVLAKRDAESEPPKGNKDLYELCGIKVGHICNENIDQRTQTFNQCDVVYGDLSSFQRDYLLDRFYGKNVLGHRNFENVIVDEVDSMLLDNGNNMLYLSHDIGNMDKLQSLFLFIWRNINQPFDPNCSLEDLAKIYDNSTIKKSVIADLYGMLMADEVDEHLWKKLIESKTIGEDGRLLKNVIDYGEHVRRLNIPNEKTKDQLIFLLNTIASRRRFIKIPPELYEFAEHHLDKFIDNAKNALFMSEGVDYVIDVDRTGLDSDLNPKIIIIDKNTGTDQVSSQWHEGLHQFLQIKHGCKLSLMSLKAVFISNVSYLKLYRNLYGLSGTLGSRDEKKLLQELYSIDLIKVPTSKPKNFFEERPSISSYKTDWVKSIYDETKKKLVKQRSVLIICESVKDVDYVTKRLTQRAVDEAQGDLNNELYKTLITPYVYKREHEEFTFGQGNALLTCGKVIIATNLAGRGTDIKLEKKLIENGGLHVILTFLPNNCRIEEQAYGRAARCGEDGSGQLVIIGNQEEGGTYSSQIFQLKNARDIYELQRLKTIKKFYDERITIEERCFKLFQKRYEDLREQWTSSIDANDIQKVLLDSFLDKWAFWLDRYSELIEKQASDVLKKDLLFERLEQFLESISFSFSSWLDAPSQLLKLGNHYANKNDYDNAMCYFKRIISDYPYYKADALYYRSYVTIKQNSLSLQNKSSSSFRQLQEDLGKARELFEERIDDSSNYQAIVESFKKKNVNNLIHIDAFNEQQKTITQIYNLFISSIDDILGHTVPTNALVNYELNEILAYDLFITLQEKGILTTPKTVPNFSSKALAAIAIEYGIPMVQKEALTKALMDNKITNGQSLVQIVDLPNMNEFWSILIDRKVLIDEMKFVVVNSERLAMIDDENIVKMVNHYKIEKPFDKLKPTELLQYPIRAEDVNCYCKEELYKKLDSEIVAYFEERGIFAINRISKINPDNIVKEQTFSKFDLITLSDLTQANISCEESIAILSILCQPDIGILVERADGKFSLKSTIDCSALPECYQDTVGAILNMRLAYQRVYKCLQEEFNAIKQSGKAEESGPLQIRLVSKPYDHLFFDLIEKGIIEDVRVNYKKLESEELTNLLGDSVTSYAKNAKSLSKKDNIEFMKKTLEQLSCGIEKLETPDSFFSSLEAALKSQQNSSVVEASWFSLCGMENLIILQEQRHSWKFWKNFAIVVGLAIAQIVAGAVLEIFTCGLGTYGAAFLINEGISDLFFATGCLFNGYMTMSSYWEHKKWSMAMSAVTCMIGGVLARGRTVSRIGYKVAGPIHTEGSKKVAEMTGKGLIKALGAKTVAKETLKRIGCKMVEGVAFGVAQSAVDHAVVNYLRGLCDSIQMTITGDLNKLFQEHQLSATVSEAIQVMGQKEAQLLMDKVSNECFEKTAMLQTMYTWYKRISGAVLHGIGEAMRKMAKADSSKSISTVLLILKGLQLASLGTNILIELGKVKESASLFLNKANKIIQDEIHEHELAASRTTERSYDVQRQAEQTMDHWKKLIIESNTQAIATHVVTPVLSYGANHLIGMVGNSIKKKYRSMKEEKYQNQFTTLKEQFDEKMKAQAIDTEELGKERKLYHDSLMELLAKTRSSKLFASIIRENVPMDMVCVQGCAYLVHKLLSNGKISDGDKAFTGIRIVVEAADGISHEYSSAPNVSHTVTIALDNNHFTVSGNENFDRTKNNCLYEALISKFPALKEVFNDGNNFRHHLSNHIEHDENMQQIISQGWHRFAINKGVYGGRIVENNYNPQVLHKRLENDTKDTINRVFKELPQKLKTDEARKLQNQALACMESITRIVNSSSDDNKAEQISAIVEKFSQELSQNGNENLNDLRRQYRNAMLRFSLRSIQTLSVSYSATLQSFREQAQLADDNPNSRTAVHIADRMNFATDDINLEHLATEVSVPRSSFFRTTDDLTLDIDMDIQTAKEMWRTDPDALASVIHGQLNKNLNEGDRRFNTVAVCVVDKHVYVAFNHVGKVNGQDTYSVSPEEREFIRDYLTKKIHLENYEVIFIDPLLKAKNQTQCRDPHGEMQILSNLLAEGILRDRFPKNNRSIRIGASKPACLSCSFKMTEYNIEHTIYGKANTSPKNWVDPKYIGCLPDRTFTTRRKSI